MIIKTPPKTGEPYVDSCYQFDFEEFDEPRVWQKIVPLKKFRSSPTLIKETLKFG